MRVAYLVNRYPAVSHSFIRREIAGVEAAGVEVLRFSIRPPDASLPDAADRAELPRTIVILAQSKAALLAAALVTALARPGRFLGAMAAAIGMAQGRPKIALRHIIYLVEACWLARRLDGVTRLHAHFGTNPAAVARLVYLLSGIPYSFTVHGPEEFDAPGAIDLPAKIGDAAQVMAISDFGRSQLMRWTKPDQWEKLKVVRCGIDEAFSSLTPAPPVSAAELCCIARLSGQKGLPLLIEAAAKLRARDIPFHLTLVGDGEMRAEIEAAIVARGLADAVTITGYLDAAGVRQRLLAARAMVLPSFAEGLPVVIMEALALRVPVVTTAIAGIPELVDAACGWVVPAGSVEALVEAMAAALAADPAQLRDMGEVGRGRVLARHDARANGAAMAALFRA
ncbi:glycosyltransferase family 4 protein [Sphingomonas sp. BIUV-7]|uniref:Glycosyltransferase family 4 protein n=1 Tax=Sphingomonas natans TaxID=3063330 RepID=A0ABT8YC54_9SPHN|nr:glycosyltransferase family 4 protein [Sphingomonas sp. BIUV-7]MDO6415925.1 glycosyltransferase family 4 protein [Sphingomonas sp. BIUV-7]